MNESRHWGKDDFLRRLYEAGGDDGHLEECAGCRAAWLAVQARRAVLIAAPEAPADLLAAQRASLFERFEKEETHGAWPWRMAPVMAACLLVLTGLTLLRTPPRETEEVASNGSQFYMEIYSMVEREEPLAAAPIHGLFEGISEE